MSRAELEAAIEADPYDPRGYAVLADHLQELGDPRGELIALQLARKEVEAAACLERHGEVLGPPPHVGFRWANGYARAITMAPSNAHAMRAALAHPSARFVMEVRVRGGMTSLAGVIAAIAEAERSTLRVLQLGDAENKGPAFKFGIHREIGDLSELWEATPHLEQIELGGSKQVLGDIDLPRATSFTLATKGLTAATAKAVATARWPKLEKLHVRGQAAWFLAAFKAPATPVAVTAAFRTLLLRDDLPALTDLCLTGTPVTDRLVADLVRSPLLPRLTSLDLSGGTLTDVGLATVLEHAKAFRHLATFDLSGNDLSETGVAKIRKALPAADVEDQAFEGAGGGDPPDDDDEEPPFEALPDD